MEGSFYPYDISLVKNRTNFLKRANKINIFYKSFIQKKDEILTYANFNMFLTKKLGILPNSFKLLLIAM